MHYVKFFMCLQVLNRQKKLIKKVSGIVEICILEFP